MHVIDEASWSWLLYAQGERRVLAVLCGSVALYELAIELDSQECARIALDRVEIERLAREIAGAPLHYWSRHAPSLLDTDAARAATAHWRALRTAAALPSHCPLTLDQPEAGQVAPTKPV